MFANLAVMGLAAAGMSLANAQCTSVIDAVNDNGLTTLGAAVQALIGTEAAGLLVPLVAATVEVPEESQITIFAPQNEAFPDPLPEDDDLSAILLNHIVGALIPSTELDEGETTVTAVGDGSLTVTLADGAVTVASPSMETPANVVTADIITCAGVIHIIDQVLVPDGIEVDVAADAPGAVEGGCVSFSDAAEEAGVSVLGAIVASLLGSETFSALTPVLSATEPVPEADQITIFNPVDAAFPPVLPGGPILEAIAANHIVQALLPVESVLEVIDDGAGSTTVTTLGGGDLIVSIGEDSAVTIESPGNELPATVIQGDIITCGGVIHVTDSVLLPLLTSDDTAAAPGPVATAPVPAAAPGLAPSLDDETGDADGTRDIDSDITAESGSSGLPAGLSFAIAAVLATALLS